MLAVWNEHLRLGRRLERLLHVADDADDLHPWEVRRRLGSKLNQLPERIAIGKVLPGHGLVDHDHPRRAFTIRLRQEPASTKRDTECREVIWRRRAEAGHDVVVRTLGGYAALLK